MKEDLENAIISAVVAGAHVNPSSTNTDPKRIAKLAVRQADAVQDELDKGNALSYAAAEALRHNGNGERGR